jgi:hypothetical protein
MTALPWTTCQYRKDATDLLVLTTRLPLHRYRDIPRFLRWTMRVRAQLRTAPGCAGYSLDAKPLRKTFWTVSAWSGKDAVEAFVHSGQHAAMLADLAGRVGDPRFVESTASSADLPPSWKDAHERIDTVS